jgi:hypothetical protein
MQRLAMPFNDTTHNRFIAKLDESGPIILPFGTSHAIFTGSKRHNDGRSRDRGHMWVGRLPVDTCAAPIIGFRDFYFGGDPLIGLLGKFVVAHRMGCDLPICAAGDHLYLTTQKGNQRDRVAGQEERSLREILGDQMRLLLQEGGTVRVVEVAGREAFKFTLHRDSWLYEPVIRHRGISEYVLRKAA